MSINLNDIANAAGTAEDQSVDSSGFVRELPRAGAALFRLRDYIEFGIFDNRNPAYKPGLNCMLTFELVHPDHMITPNDTKIAPFPDTISIFVKAATSSGSSTT